MRTIYEAPFERLKRPAGNQSRRRSMCGSGGRCRPTRPSLALFGYETVHLRAPTTSLGASPDIREPGVLPDSRVDTMADAFRKRTGRGRVVRGGRLGGAVDHRDGRQPDAAPRRRLPPPRSDRRLPSVVRRSSGAFGGIPGLPRTHAGVSGRCRVTSEPSAGMQQCGRVRARRVRPADDRDRVPPGRPFGVVR